MISLSAHFDGERIQLDEPYELPRDVPLLVTILSPDQEDASRQELLDLSSQGLSRAYGDDEPEYTLADVKR